MEGLADLLAREREHLVGQAPVAAAETCACENGGEGGIRTLGTRKGTTVFETAPFDRSGTSPLQWQAPSDGAGR